MGFIKGSLLQTGGVVLGGVVATKATTIVITEEIHKMLDDMDTYKPKLRYPSYKDHHNQRSTELVFETRGDAEMILDEMAEVIDHYGMVTVQDLYDLAGVSSCYTDSKFGWTSINTARVVRVHDGYLLKLPRATYI